MRERDERERFLMRCFFFSFFFCLHPIQFLPKKNKREEEEEEEGGGGGGDFFLCSLCMRVKRSLS